MKNCKDREVARRKRILTKNVPYRIQAPFMDKIKGKEWNVSESALIPAKQRAKYELARIWRLLRGSTTPLLAAGLLTSRINQERRLMYYFENLNGMQATIRLNQEWFAYIHKNQEIIKGWLMYNIIIYLQKRNPSVPGIADKLYPPQERKLEKVKKYWKLLLTLQQKIL